MNGGTHLPALELITADEAALLSGLFIASTRRNGKVLLTPARAVAMHAAMQAPYAPTPLAFVGLFMTERALALLKRDDAGYLIEPDLISSGAQHHEQPLPQEPILGAGYVRHPAPAPAREGSCAQCCACRLQASAPATPATGEKA